jgi:hypothetical protein
MAGPILFYSFLISQMTMNKSFSSFRSWCRILVVHFFTSQVSMVLAISMLNCVCHGRKINGLFRVEDYSPSTTLAYYS